MTERSAAGLIRTLLKFDRDGDSGTLDVRAEGLRTSIYLRRGEVVFADGGTLGETLGRLLVDDAMITEAQYAKAIAVMTESLVDNEQMRLGEVLVTLGLLGIEDVQRALSSQVRRKIMRCLQWDKMQLSFDRSAERLRSVGSFPTPVEPLVVEGVRRFYHRGRMDEMMAPYLPHYGRLRDHAAAVCGRFRLERDDVALVRAIDGTRTLGEILSAASERGVDAHPVLTALLLADAIEPLAQPIAADGPSAASDGDAARRTTDAAPPSASGRARRAAQVSRRPRDDAAAAAAARPGRQSPRARPADGADRRPAPTRAPASGDGARQLPRRGGGTARTTVDEGDAAERHAAERPRGVAQRPAWRAREGTFRGRRSVWREDEASRRQRPTWRDLRQQPRRVRGTHRALGDWREGASEEERKAEVAVMSTLPPRKPTAAPPEPQALDEAALRRKARVEAEQAFFRGMRLLYAERLPEAEGQLRHAAEAVPDAAEYQLSATWARYRSSADRREREKLRVELEGLARAAARQDRGLAFPPYVLAHLALGEGNGPRALKLFEVAAYREPANKDAERHVRLLKRRLGGGRG